MSFSLIEIAIPTYNGSATIVEALDSLLAFVGSNQVRIRIYDNASTDKTVEVVNSLCKADARISISVFNQNLGFDGNVRRCISHAEADYVWLFSDDDVAPSRGFEELMAIIKSKKPGMLYFNHFPFYQNSLKKAGLLRFNKENKCYSEGLDFLYDCDLGFISSQVVERGRAQECERAMKDSDGHAHLEIATRIALGNSGPFVLMGSCGVGARTLALPRYNSVKQGFIAKAVLFERLWNEGLFTDVQFNSFIKQLVSGYFVYSVLKDRAYSVTPPKTLRASLKDFKKLGSLSSRNYYFARAAAWFPSFLAKTIVQAYYWKRSMQIKFRDS